MYIQYIYNYTEITKKITYIAKSVYMHSMGAILTAVQKSKARNLKVFDHIWSPLNPPYHKVGSYELLQ